LYRLVLGSFCVFQEVHHELTERFIRIQQSSKQPFLDTDTKELGKFLRAIEQELTKLPNKMRTYQVFHKFKEIVQEKIRINKTLFGDLASGVLRQKHWVKVFRILNLQQTDPARLSLQDMWDAPLMKYLNDLRDILTTAQGEMALEQFLKDLDVSWENTFFETVDYKFVFSALIARIKAVVGSCRGKCFLVRNWTDLMADVTDKVSDVMSMKQSPFFKSFEREATTWEEKLNSAQAIFDVMIDVQRRWVYLQGVFSNSADVQRQLNLQYQKFKGFNRDFVQLMKGIREDSLVDHWVTPEKNLLENLESYQTTLNSIQKALQKYLEDQRAKFSRFYFVGDEDLLEIIGLCFIAASKHRFFEMDELNR